MDSLEKTKKMALNILGNRNFSVQEMKKRLIKKGVSEDDAELTVTWLVEMSYLNDSNFATLIVTHYSAKGYGTARIKDELFTRGIPREYWDEKLAEIDSDIVDEAVVKHLTKRLKANKGKIDLRRATESLITRGFSFEDARLAVKRFLDSQEQEE